MAYDHRLEIQRAAYIAALGAGYERMAFPELQHAWLGQQGYTQSTRLARLSAWAAANNVAMTKASTEAGATGAAQTAPEFTSVPTLDGPHTAGDLVTATPGTVTGNPTPTVARQWYLDASPIGGATSLTYQTSADQAGGELVIRETASNVVQSGVTADSVGLTLGTPAVAGVVQTSSSALHKNGSATVYTQLNAFDVAPTPHNSATMIMSCHDNGVGARPSSVTIGGVAAVHVPAAEHDTTSTRETAWYVPDLGAAPNRDVVITYATATDRYQTFGVMEVTPLAPSPVDQARGMYWYDGGGWPQVISLPGATTQASELLMVMTICGSGQPDINITSPASTGYTSLFKEIDSNTYQGGQASYKVLTATETSTATWNNTAATSDHWSTVMVSFKFA